MHEICCCGHFYGAHTMLGKCSLCVACRAFQLAPPQPIDVPSPKDRTSPISQTEIAVARAVIGRATAAPWVLHTPGGDPHAHICGWSQHHEPEGPASGLSSTGPEVWSKEQALADAAFMAIARSLLPRLLDEVGTLDKLHREACDHVGRLHQDRDHWKRRYEDASNQLADLEREYDRLQDRDR